jgi:hypothetical protein
MFNHFPQSELKIVAPDGTVRSVERGLVQSKLVIIPNKAAVVHVGDEIRRTLPNGVEETFEVLDPIYYDQSHAIPSHYQVKISRKGSFPAGTGGHFTFNVSGPNARVNFGSHDHSRNIVADHSVFGDLKSAIKSAPTNSDEQSRLIALVEDMETQTGSRSSFLSAYQRFIASAANHMTIIAPFLPALTKFIA